MNKKNLFFMEIKESEHEGLTNYLISTFLLHDVYQYVTISS